MIMIRSLVLALTLVPSPQDERPQILVVHDSRTGFTETMARAVAEGAASVEGITVRSVPMAAVEDADIVRASGILVGSPVHWAGASADTRRFLERLGGALSNNEELGPGSTARLRAGGAFVTAGAVSSGKELARVEILAALLNMRFVVVGGDEPDGFGTLGPQATTGESDPGLSDAELAEARRFGERFARMTLALVR